VKRAEAKAKRSAQLLREKESKEVQEHVKVCFFFSRCGFEGDGVERGIMRRPRPVFSSPLHTKFYIANVLGH
jgi:hypothetical protein